MRILKEMLNTLKSIDGTLKRIEQSVSEEKQHEVIKEAVSHAMVGERYEPTPKDFSQQNRMPLLNTELLRMTFLYFRKVELRVCQFHILKVLNWHM